MSDIILPNGFRCGVDLGATNIALCGVNLNLVIMSGTAMKHS